MDFASVAVPEPINTQHRSQFPAAMQVVVALLFWIVRDLRDCPLVKPVAAKTVWNVFPVVIDTEPFVVGRSTTWANAGTQASKKTAISGSLKRFMMVPMCLPHQ